MVKKPKIIIADPSYIVINGLKSLILNIGKFETKIVYSWQNLIDKVNKSDFDFIIFNPVLLPAKNFKSLTTYFKNTTGQKLISIYTDSIADHIKLQCLGAININNQEEILTDAFKELLIDKKEAVKIKSSKLSTREESVVRCIALGMTNKEIADSLFISTHTVVTHRKNITRKLGIKTVSGLTVYAILNNLAKFEEIE